MNSQPLDLDAIEAEWEGFEGPYTAEFLRHFGDAVIVNHDGTEVARIDRFDNDISIALAERFAGAPTHIATLIAEVRSLRARVAALESQSPPNIDRESVERVAKRLHEAYTGITVWWEFSSSFFYGRIVEKWRGAACTNIGSVPRGYAATPREAALKAIRLTAFHWSSIIQHGDPRPHSFERLREKRRLLDEVIEQFDTLWPAAQAVADTTNVRKNTSQPESTRTK